MHTYGWKRNFDWISSIWKSLDHMNQSWLWYFTLSKWFLNHQYIWYRWIFCRYQAVTYTNADALIFAAHGTHLIEIALKHKIYLSKKFCFAYKYRSFGPRFSEVWYENILLKIVNDCVCYHSANHQYIWYRWIFCRYQAVTYTNADALLFAVHGTHLIEIALKHKTYLSRKFSFAYKYRPFGPRFSEVRYENILLKTVMSMIVYVTIVLK